MADNHVRPNNLIGIYDFQGESQQNKFWQSVFLELLRLLKAEKSTAFWLFCTVFFTHILSVLPWDRLSSSRSRGIQVAQPAQPDEPVAERPNENEMLEEDFEVKYDEDTSRISSIKRRYDSRERLKQLQITGKGTLRLNTVSDNEETTTRRCSPRFQNR